MNVTNPLTATDLERLMAEAVLALREPSTLLEYAPRMSKQELEDQINKRIDMIRDNNQISDEHLEQLKVEARLLAIMRLRRR